MRCAQWASAPKIIKAQKQLHGCSCGELTAKEKEEMEHDLKVKMNIDVTAKLNFAQAGEATSIYISLSG